MTTVFCEWPNLGFLGDLAAGNPMEKGRAAGV